MERYLTRNALERSLEQGRTVEQWLGVRTENDHRILKWLSIERDRAGHTILRISEVLDEGGPGLYDVYEFTPYDSNAEFGVELSFDSPEQALDHAIRNLGADPQKFVDDGVVQLEYKDYLSKRPA